jgi:hypothetical protein
MIVRSQSNGSKIVLDRMYIFLYLHLVQLFGLMSCEQLKLHNLKTPILKLRKITKQLIFVLFPLFVLKQESRANILYHTMFTNCISFIIFGKNI